MILAQRYGQLAGRCETARSHYLRTKILDFNSSKRRSCERSSCKVHGCNYILLQGSSKGCIHTDLALVGHMSCFPSVAAESEFETWGTLELSPDVTPQ